MSTPTGNEALSLTLITNVQTAAQAAKDACDFATSSPQLPAQGAPELAALCSALSSAVAGPLAEINQAVAILNEAASQT
jgi:hypothetical protein